jgi:hypothetical protein
MSMHSLISSEQKKIFYFVTALQKASNPALV